MYVIPVDELSTSEMRNFRRKAKEDAIAEALRLSLASSRDELDVSGIRPATDLGAPAGSGYTNEAWITGAVAANTWTSVYDTGNVAQLGRRKVLVIYGIFNATPVPRVTAVRFRLGATGTTTLGWVHLEGLIDIKLTQECYLSEPIVYTPDQYVNIQCYSRVAIPAADGERLGFRGFVVEPVGENVS